jgi:uncharacterized protein YggE
MDKEKFEERIMRHKMASKLLIGLLLVVLIIYIGALAKNEIQNKAKGVENVSQKTITVSGEGKIYAKPDIGKITLGVTNEAKTVSEAQGKSTEAINKIMDFLKSSGIEEKDIKTTNYSITPVYDYTERKQTLRGYQVSQNLEVKIRDLTKSGDIIAGAAGNGANLVGGLTFTIDEPDALKAEARTQAIEKAKEQAQKLAADLGIKLGKLISFVESDGYPVYYGKEMTLGLGLSAETVSPPIPTGENEITIDVSLTYEIK